MVKKTTRHTRKRVFKRRRFRRSFRKRRVALYKRPHRFIRWTDWVTMWGAQGASFNGNFGLAGAISSGAGTTFVGSFLSVNVPASTAGYASYAFSPCLYSMANYTEFTSLFDMFQITGFSLKITGMYNDYQAGVVNSVTASLGQIMPIVHMVIDYDDNYPVAASQSGVDAMREYSSYRQMQLNGNNVLKTYCKRPGVKIITDAEQTGAGFTTVGMVKRSPVLDLGAAGQVQHHGIKVLFECLNNLTGTTAYWTFKVESRIYLTMIEQR